MKEKSIKKIFLILPLLVFALSYSQPCPCEKHNPPPEDPKPLETLENLRMWRLTEELNLTEEQASKIFPKLKRIRELKEKRKEERNKEIEKLSELLAKKAKGDEIKKQVELIRNNDKKHQNECEKIQDEIFAILTPEQQAKYLLFHVGFEGKIKKMLRKLKGWKRGF
ncbi:MAG: Spy/CpxP family protein refolding chaperone [candidate division WOR-3 bacterium]